MDRFHSPDGPLRETFTSIVEKVYHTKNAHPENTRCAHENGSLIRYVLQKCNV